MDNNEFLAARTKLHKTQKKIAALLGVSLKAIHSYEQGWRKIPVHVERQIFLLLSRQRDSSNKAKSCWILKKCPKERRDRCPAWEFQAGKLCWFINGTICECNAKDNWQEKMAICRKCKVLNNLL